MSNSPLVSYTKISPNRTKNRNHAIDTITIHCVVGQCSVETLGRIFEPTSRKASSNYGVGVDGRIGMYCEEKDRSWCSSNATNDHRAITIEVASDTKEPYAVNAKAYAALIELCVDICKRNGIKKLVWSTDKSTRVNHLNGCNMTVHRDYANKSCPGTYLYERMGDIASKVNAKLGATADEPAPSVPEKPSTSDCPFAVNDTVEFKSDAKKYHPAGSGIPSWVKTGYTHIVTQTTSNGKAVYKGGERCVLLGKKVNKKTNKKEAGINTWVSVNVLQKVGGTDATTFKPYLVKVTASELNIRKGPGTGYAVTGSIKDKGVYTIVLEDASGEWGKLKSGAGWIALDYTKKR